MEDEDSEKEQTHYGDYEYKDSSVEGWNQKQTAFIQTSD